MASGGCASREPLTWHLSPNEDSAMTRAGVLLSAILFFFMTACEGRILPSRALVVDLSVAQTNREEVAVVADDFFQA